LLLPLIEAALANDISGWRVYATGMHFSRRHGNSLEEILAAGLESVLDGCR